MDRQEKAIRFMLENEDDGWDKGKAQLEDLQDNAKNTFVGLTERDDTKYLPADVPSIAALARLYRQDMQRAIGIIIDVYKKAYWNPQYDLIINERLAIRIFDLGVNMGVATAVSLLQRALNDLGANLAIDGKFGPATLEAVNKYSLVGDSIEKAFNQNLHFFMGIYSKMGEIITDIQNFDFTELNRDLFDLSNMAKQIFGKVVDDDVLHEFYEEAKIRYETIAKKPRFTRFLKGWMNRLNKDEYKI